MDDDRDMVESVAIQVVNDMGSRCLDFLKESAELATALEDDLSAQVWRDISIAAERLLGRQSLNK